MKTLFFLLTLLCFATAYAEESGDAWQSSTLSESTIKKIMEAKREYEKCVASQMQKPAYLEMDTRKATEAIMKECEPTLGKIKAVYASEKVPNELADRHLKQIRIKTTRKAIQNLMFEQAAKQAGQP